jgi:hypothetical protein
MRYLRRLPTLLWALWLVGLFAILTSLAIATWTLWPPPGTQGSAVSRGQILSPPLGMLGFALTFPALFYQTHHNSQASRSPHWLDRWPGQLLAALVPAALPAVSLAIVLLVPPSSPVFSAVWPLGYFSGLVLFVTLIAGLVVAVQ